MTELEEDAATFQLQLQELVKFMRGIRRFLAHCLVTMNIITSFTEAGKQLNNKKVMNCWETLPRQQSGQKNNAAISIFNSSGKSRIRSFQMRIARMVCFVQW